MNPLSSAIVRRSSIVSSLCKSNRNVAHPMIRLGCLCALFAANVAVADESWDRVCDELEAAYKRGLSVVEKKGESYELTTYGDGERSSDLWRYTLKTYRDVADRIVKERGKDGWNYRRKVELWLAGALDKLEADFRRKEKDADAHGSYSGIFHLGSKTDLYVRAIQILMLKTEPAARWARIASATWKIKGKTVTFANGEARAELTWRIFENKSADNSCVWMPQYRPKDVHSWNGKDYAFVRFSVEGNQEGCPATTDESMVFEFDKSVVTRVVGLNNYFNRESRLDAKRGLLILLGEDGYAKPAKFVIDLKTMRIKKEGTVLPSCYIEDGYDKLFLVGTSR